MRLRPQARARRIPYTAAGIRRVRCCFRGCTRGGHATWQVCADGRVFRAVCYLHDIAINRLVLSLVDDPDVERKLESYTRKVLEQVRDRGGVEEHERAVAELGQLLAEGMTL